MSDPYFNSDRSARHVQAEVLEWDGSSVGGMERSRMYFPIPIYGSLILHIDLVKKFVVRMPSSCLIFKAQTSA
jgi:hypothetical protein